MPPAVAAFAVLSGGIGGSKVNFVPRDILSLIVGIIGSGLISWAVTHCYFKKSLKQQAEAASRETKRISDAVTSKTNLDAELLRQRRIEKCLEEYRRCGTPVRVIDTYSDLPDEQKAELLDTVLLRARGRPAKQNKYRKPDANA